MLTGHYRQNNQATAARQVDVHADNGKATEAGSVMSQAPALDEVSVISGILTDHRPLISMPWASSAALTD